MAIALMPLSVLAQTGSISGKVTNEATSLPIAGVEVVASSTVGGIRSATTDSAGMYTITNVRPASYFLFTYNAIGFIHEIYDNIPCRISCSFEAPSFRNGTPVTVEAGATTADRDFVLTPGGVISGSVRSAANNSPIAGMTVVAYGDVRTPNLLETVAIATTDSAGNYTIRGLHGGDYYLLVENRSNSPQNAQFIAEIYDDIKCFTSCSSNLRRGAPVSVTANAITGGKDFLLDIGGVISGTVTNGPDTRVSIVANVGGVLVGAGSNQVSGTGSYMVAGLPTGTYYAFTFNLFKTNEIYDNVICPSTPCSATAIIQNGTPITVTAGATTSNINFTLEDMVSFTGTVKSGTTPLAGSVLMYNAATLEQLRSAPIDPATGIYEFRGLPVVTSYLVTSVAGYVNEIYDDLPCVGACALSTMTSSGVQVIPMFGATRSGIDFDLARGGTISGTVRDVESNRLADVPVLLYRMFGGSSPEMVASVVTDSSGNYQVAGLLAGTYYAVTASPLFANQIFGGVPCSGMCNPGIAVSSGTPIALADTVVASERDFTLTLGGAISGTVTNAITSTPLANVPVEIYARAGNAAIVAGRATTDASGAYTVRGLAPGTYRASTNIAHYANQIFSGVACHPFCTPGEVINRGASISVVAGAITSNRNFTIAPLNPAGPPPGAPTGLTVTATRRFNQNDPETVLEFRWSAPNESSGGPVARYALEAGLLPATPARTFLTTTSSLFLAFPPASVPRRFYVRVRAANDNGASVPSNEVEVVTTTSGLQIHAPMNLRAFTVDSRLFGTWGPRPALESYVLEAGTRTGLSDIGALPARLSRAFVGFSPVPNGVYFVRVRATGEIAPLNPTNEVMLVVGDVPTPPYAPTNLTAFADALRNVTLGWTPPRGAVSSYLIEAGSASGFSDIGVFDTGNASTSVSFTGVPSGTYYVRIRAVNERGASVVSPELALIVR